ncbi:MAG: hypothetical protein QN172_10935 [Armatimonadota bacterium]|nr:hypothetical protein [Armatimonadota bacterium]MDR7563981.1 hypothetical protein [Armatimonadota bacterium]MDR7602954.1 hypothetical protein [Armatimonadota bacterium]
MTYVEELGEWVIAYVAVGRSGPAVALAAIRDFRSARRLGTVLAPPNKDAALFPRRIRSRYWMLHRPSSGGAEHIWIAESQDLVYWGRPRLVLPERGGTWWDGARVGAGGGTHRNGSGLACDLPRGQGGRGRAQLPARRGPAGP